MKTNTRGFIPLVAIILLGLTAIAGGTIATVSIQHNKQPIARAPEVEPIATTSSAYLAPVSTNVKSSTSRATSTPKVAQEARVGQITAILGTRTQQDCDDVKELAVVRNQKNKRSLTEDIQVICSQLATPGPDTQEQIEKWRLLEERAQTKIALLKKMYKVTSLTWDTGPLEVFISNPSPDAFRVMCDSATSVNLPTNNKEVLSSDRTTMVSVPKTLYDIMGCNLLDQYHAILDVHPGFLRWDLKDGDTDNLRENKINYNKQLEGLLGNYKVAIIGSTIVPLIDPSTGHLIAENESNQNSATIDVYVPEDRAKRLVGDPIGIAFIYDFDSTRNFIVPKMIKR